MKIVSIKSENKDQKWDAEVCGEENFTFNKHYDCGGWHVTKWREPATEVRRPWAGLERENVRIFEKETQCESELSWVSAWVAAFGLGNKNKELWTCEKHRQKWEIKMPQVTCFTNHHTCKSIEILNEPQQQSNCLSNGTESEVKIGHSSVWLWLQVLWTLTLLMFWRIVS